MTYEEFVSLQLNKHRVRRQRSVDLLAALAAHNNSPLDESWGDALADDPAEAAEIVAEANRERAFARARERRNA